MSANSRSNRYSNRRARCRTGFGSPTPSSSRQQREQRSADHLADGQSFGRSIRADAPNQAEWKFDGECQFGFAGRDWFFQALGLFEVTIGLTGRNGAVPRQLADRIGELIDMQQQVARAIEALGFLGLVGARHLSLTYNRIRHKSMCTRLLPKFQPPFKFEVIFCVRGVISPLLSNLYLTEVDRMLERAIATTRRGQYTHVQYARFADDRAPRAQRAEEGPMCV